ncbi:hypothetical protein TWF694_000920 [Orbilia ellipsospora]|uniref:Uncharacterized protein n=1 Tax=Orbilia ellipsospora TaxID=2528407 RepID=A0AAV9XQ32_9PEZI
MDPFVERFPDQDERVIKQTYHIFLKLIKDRYELPGIYSEFYSIIRDMLASTENTGVEHRIADTLWLFKWAVTEGLRSEERKLSKRENAAQNLRSLSEAAQPEKYISEDESIHPPSDATEPHFQQYQEGKATPQGGTSTESQLSPGTKVKRVLISDCML